MEIGSYRLMEIAETSGALLRDVGAAWSSAKARATACGRSRRSASWAEIAPMPTTPRRRNFAPRLILPMFLLAAAFLFCPFTAAASSSGHPYFDDQGTLDWHHSLADARAAAQRTARAQKRVA